ncbi:MAG: hypothetical protein SV422_14355 [Pseudomonadota bacterium]|nr:hypothetical protein [Pseudomonadota bacterium]
MKHLLLPAFLLAAALLPGLAVADGNGLEWRRGGGYDIYYRAPGNSWRRAPGSAVDVGDGWVIGTDRRHGGFSIYRWDGHRWHRMPGAGVRIGGSYYSPWVVNDRGERFSWTGYGWREDRNAGRHAHEDRHDGRHDRRRDDNDWNRGYNGRDRDNNGFGRRDDDRGRGNRR